MSLKRRLHLFQCLCQAVNPGLAEAQRDRLEARYAALSPDELSELFTLADRALLLPSWHLGLARHNLSHLLPVDLQEALDAAWQLNRVRNQRLRIEARTVSEALAEIDCRAVHLKGLGHVLAGTYDDHGARMTSDMDVLVPADRVQDAARHLLAKGFSPVYGELALMTQSKLSHHLDGLTRQDMIAGIELHHGFSVDHPDWPCMPDILAQSELVVGPPHVRTPNAQHAAQIAVAHSTLRYRNIGQEYLHLRDMTDLLFLAETRALDIVELQRGFQRAGHGAALGWFVVVTDRLFGSDLGRAGALTTGADRIRGRIELVRWLSCRVPQSGSLFDRSRTKLGHVHSVVTRSAHRRHLMALLTDPNYRKAREHDVPPILGTICRAVGFRPDCRTKNGGFSGL